MEGLVRPALLVGACILLIQSLIFLARRYIIKSKYKPIPGPAQLPFIGRVHDLPRFYMWHKFKEWSDTYGPIYMTSMMGHKLLVLSEERIADDLLVKRGKIYSDRPAMQSVIDSKSTTGTMEYLPLMGKNQYWARQRKWAHSQLMNSAKDDYHGVMDFEVKRLLFKVLETPDDIQSLIEDMASKIMCTLAWDEPSVSQKNSIDAEDLLRQISPAGPITNLMTPLWYLPYWMNPWRQAEAKRHDELHAWQFVRAQAVKAKMAKGTQRPCWISRYLEEDKSGLTSEMEASLCVGMLALMGVLTAGGPPQYFLMSMVHHPEWFKKCQKEMDEVCGSRMPCHADYPRLPTLRACIKETIRWRPNIPTGVGHEVMEDDVYEGYFIPKGTRILPLEWAILRDPKRYPDPWNFRPERWLQPGWPTFKEPLTQYPTIKKMSPFGWGQRTCIGTGLTEDENILACGSICWGYDLDFKTDPLTGQKIDIPTDKSNSLLIIRPDRFDISVVPRSEARKQQIIENWRVAEEADRKSRESFGGANFSV
ncbi:cytochrome P450 [Clohesyomyces aquaticus]|uniref:Cytochrome P450 n=1 Tax=Clohesyomyces aquaticus TaxID=1231657 RepID=A0A1Y1Z3M2_9PLEO|nr:cytochrome P450 [Clohesyomyces aquaticus]